MSSRGGSCADPRPSLRRSRLGSASDRATERGSKANYGFACTKYGAGAGSGKHQPQRQQGSKMLLVPGPTDAATE